MSIEIYVVNEFKSESIEKREENTTKIIEKIMNEYVKKCEYSKEICKGGLETDECGDILPFVNRGQE